MMVALVASEGCDEAANGGAVAVDGGDAAPVPAASASVKGVTPDGGVGWATVEVCHDQVVFRSEPYEKNPTMRCTSPQAHGHEFLYGEKDNPRPALICTCPGPDPGPVGPPVPPQKAPETVRDGGGKLCLGPCP